MEFKNLQITEHPLIEHKLTLMRDKDISTSNFRLLLEEVTSFMTYEILKNVETKEKIIDTPVVKKHKGKEISEELIIVPILRAGLGMVQGIRELVPNVKEGHVGIYRDEETLKPIEYYSKLPKTTKGAHVIVLDPMLATGVSASDAISVVKGHNPAKITFVCIVAAPEGITKLERDHPDVKITTASLDDGLNPEGYIVPGLGDAGDRLFGTK